MVKYKHIILPLMLALTMSGCTKTVVKNLSETKVDMKVATDSSLVRDLDEENSVSESINRFFIKANDKKSEITKYVTNHNDGEIYVSPDGIEYIFGLESVPYDETDKKLFSKRESENNLKSPEDGDFYKMTGENHTLILKEGSKLYIMDDSVKKFEDAVVKNRNGMLSVPFKGLAFSYGYESIGMEIDGNNYSVILNETFEAPVFENSNVDTSYTSPDTNTANTITKPSEQTILPEIETGGQNAQSIN